MVCRCSDLVSPGNRSASGPEIRNQFFFGTFFEAIVNEGEDPHREIDLQVYSADNARIPQIKLILNNELHVDISFAIVNNAELQSSTVYLDAS